MTDARHETYYDAAEVEDYVRTVSDLIQRLQADLRTQEQRAQRAEQELQKGRGPVPVEVAGPAGEEAVARAGAIVDEAHRRGERLIEAAARDAASAVAAAEQAARQRTRQRELQLLAAVNSFVEQSHQLRDQFRVIETLAADWRLDLATSTLPVGMSDPPAVAPPAGANRGVDRGAPQPVPADRGIPGPPPASWVPTAR